MCPASRGMTLSSVMTSHVISTDSMRSLVKFPASVSKASPYSQVGCKGGKLSTADTLETQSNNAGKHPGLMVLADLAPACSMAALHKLPLFTLHHCREGAQRRATVANLQHFHLQMGSRPLLQPALPLSLARSPFARGTAQHPPRPPASQTLPCKHLTQAPRFSQPPHQQLMQHSVGQPSQPQNARQAHMPFVTEGTSAGAAGSILVYVCLHQAK